ncbi:uncharacterized protein TNCV_1098281 [Trichonephila clavipes]|nr:uncharacterized protein TNCV_1098281 [Trichonephila clavipes]
MEPVGAYRIFARSEDHSMLRYTDYYGDGDSKAFDAVKDIYGKDSVTKLECIGHIQKRVGTRLRKLKSRNKGLGGKNRTFPSLEKVLSRGRRSCGECSEELGEKGLLESRSPTFRIDSSKKDMRRSGLEGPEETETI